MPEQNATCAVLVCYFLLEQNNKVLLFHLGSRDCLVAHEGIPDKKESLISATLSTTGWGNLNYPLGNLSWIWSPKFPPDSLSLQRNYRCRRWGTQPNLTQAFDSQEGNIAETLSPDRLNAEEKSIFLHLLDIFEKNKKRKKQKLLIFEFVFHLWQTWSIYQSGAPVC